MAELYVKNNLVFRSRHLKYSTNSISFILGVCRKNPCGNRGLCVEKSLTTYECRCYFDYMGPKCEEHASKTNHSIWSCKQIMSTFSFSSFIFHYFIIIALLPAHTRILFDMLKEAYRTKIKEKSFIGSNNGQIDFNSLLTTVEAFSTTSTPREIASITLQGETTEKEYVIPAQDVQLEKIFPDKNTLSSFEINTYESTKQSFAFSTPATIITYPERNMTSTNLMKENTTNKGIEPVSFNMIEGLKTENNVKELNTAINSTPVQWFDDNRTIDNKTAKIFNDSNNEFVAVTTTKSNDLSSTNVDMTLDNYRTTDGIISSSMKAFEQTTSISTTTMSQKAHSQLLYRLCQQIVAYILPDTSSMPSACTQASLSLVSDSLSKNKHASDTLVFWLSKYFKSSTSTSTPSTLPSLIINKIQTLSMPLRRVNIEDALHQTENNTSDKKS